MKGSLSLMGDELFMEKILIFSLIAEKIWIRTN